MFRVADARDRKVIAPAVRACLYSWNGRVTREGEPACLGMALRISKLDPLMLLPITIEHVIDETSPCSGTRTTPCGACHAEIVVAFEGCVDATGLSFSAGQSYLPPRSSGDHVPPIIRARAERVHQARGGARALPRARAAGNAGESRGARGAASRSNSEAALCSRRSRCARATRSRRRAGEKRHVFPAAGASCATPKLSDSIVIDDSMTLATFRKVRRRHAAPWPIAVRRRHRARVPARLVRADQRRGTTPSSGASTPRRARSSCARRGSGPRAERRRHGIWICGRPRSWTAT